MILLRCSNVSDEVIAQARSLRAAAQERVVIALDDRAVMPAAVEEEVLPFSRAETDRLGLYTPKDFRWRCGDYILYLAANRYPKEQFFYLIESDVRIRDPELFFTGLRLSKADFMAADLRRAERSWYWSSYACALDAAPYRCLFPVVRVRREAVEALVGRRRKHSQSWARRMLWPNDEAFVATSIAHSAFTYVDFNMVLPNAWRRKTFSFDKPIRASRLDSVLDESYLYHPVLSEPDFSAKLRRLASDRGHGADRRIIKRLLRPVLSQTFW